LPYGSYFDEFLTGTQPQIEGFTFKGWYHDSAFTTPVRATDKVENDMTLYAHIIEGEDEADPDILAWLTENWPWVAGIGGGVLALAFLSVLAKRKTKEG
jgi:uncharacterized repeat protein (TIGR02543 family)